MTITAIIFFALGATVLWGGLVTTLSITIYKEKESKKENCKLVIET